MSGDLDYGTMLTGLGGGLALFLYGMRKMTEALKTVAGARMKTLLGRVTTNRFTGALAGASVTAIIQSSSVTTVLVVGFITSGLMTLTQSLGIILGANVGTTVTAQIVAFKVTKYALLMIAAGYLIEITARQEKIRQYGIVAMGLGLIFFGMNLMSDAASPLRTFEPFMELMKEMRHPLLAILVGAVFTALVQSSSATTGIVIVMASEGLVPLEAGIGMIFGSNIGTCVTALIAGIGRPREALQAAVAHVIFNVGGVVLWFAFIPQFAEFVRVMSPDYKGVDAAARLALETPRQIANAHTLFNIGNAFIFIWLTAPLAWIVRKIVPSSPPGDESSGKPIYLDDFYLEQPAVGLDRARLEIGRLGDLVVRMVADSYPVMMDGAPSDLARLHEGERVADELHGAIIPYIGKLSLTDLIEPQPGQIYEYIAAANYFENASDVVGANMVKIGNKRIAGKVPISAETRRMVGSLHAAALDAGEKAVEAFVNNDSSLAREVEGSKEAFDNLVGQTNAHLVKRLVAKEPERLGAFRLESDMVDDYKRLHTIFRRIANTVNVTSVEEASRQPDEQP